MRRARTLRLGRIGGGLVEQPSTTERAHDGADVGLRVDLAVDVVVAGDD